MLIGKEVMHRLHKLHKLQHIFSWADHQHLPSTDQSADSLHGQHSQSSSVSSLTSSASSALSASWATHRHARGSRPGILNIWQKTPGLPPWRWNILFANLMPKYSFVSLWRNISIIWWRSIPMVKWRRLTSSRHSPSPSPPDLRRKFSYWLRDCPIRMARYVSLLLQGGFKYNIPPTPPPPHSEVSAIHVLFLKIVGNQN